MNSWLVIHHRGLQQFQSFAKPFLFHTMEKTMKRTSILAFALSSIITISAIPQLHAAPQSFDGIISDSMCGRKHMLPGKTDAQCIQECVKNGSSYALVAGRKVYTLTGKAQNIAPYAGKHVHINGNLQGSTITVTSISGMPHNMKM
jgi:hypothetical protein